MNAEEASALFGTAAAPAPASRTWADVSDRLRRGDAWRRMLPWIGSIGAHALLAVGAVVITWTVVGDSAHDELPFVTLMDFRAPQYDPVVPAPTDPVPATTAPLPGPAAPAAPAAALERREVSMPPGALEGLDRPAEVAPGDPGARPLAPLAVAPPERPVSFAGLAATNAGRIVYVVDASGSLTGTFPAILRELEASLRQLDWHQSFSVVFFQKGSSLAVPPGRMMPAEPATVSRAVEWMRRQVFPAGGSNPLPALKAALAMRPDLVFVLSSGITGEGEFEVSRGEILEALDRLNPPISRTGRRRARIQCVQFLERDPGGTLERIAERHGGPGAFRYLSRDDLGLAPGESAAGAPIE